MPLAAWFTAGRRSCAAVALSIATACGAGYDFGTPPPRTPLATPRATEPACIAGCPSYRASAERGAVIYAALCAECHGASGYGDGAAGRLLDPPPTSFRDEAYMPRQRPSWYHRAVSQGVVGSAMPRWDHLLADDDRWDAAFYAWSMSDDARRTARARSVYARFCANCHGLDGDGVAESPLAKPSRVALSRAEAVRQIFDVHAPADLGGLDAAAAEDASAYVWTFLYEPSDQPVR